MRDKNVPHNVLLPTKVGLAFAREGIPFLVERDTASPQYGFGHSPLAYSAHRVIPPQFVQRPGARPPRRYRGERFMPEQVAFDRILSRLGFGDIFARWGRAYVYKGHLTSVAITDQYFGDNVGHVNVHRSYRFGEHTAPAVETAPGANELVELGYQFPATFVGAQFKVSSDHRPPLDTIVIGNRYRFTIGESVAWAIPHRGKDTLGIEQTHPIATAS